jgi:small subunit ribosomal protein S17
MASSRKPKSDTEKDTDAKNANDKTTEKKTKTKDAVTPKGKAKAASKTDEPSDDAKPVIKKKRKTAREIDKTQAKRLVVPKPRLKRTRKVVRVVKETKEARNIGVEVEPPTEDCNDPCCPFHGTLSVRGQIINGIVVTSKMDKTAIVQREIRRFIPKYERYEKRTHNYAVHNPPCLNVQRGDLVKIMECRPLSKSKSFVVIERM